MTNKELQEKLAAARAELEEKKSNVNFLTEKLAEQQHELREVKPALEAATARIAKLEEALRQKTAATSDSPVGETIDFSQTLVLADVQALSHWSNKSSARWGVDFEGSTKEIIAVIAKQMQTPQEKILELPDGNWRLITANRNAAMKIAGAAEIRIAHMIENGETVDCIVTAVPLRSMSLVARDAARAKGVGRFDLGSSKSMSFYGPAKVFIKGNGDVVIRQFQEPVL
jgi:hypothetical protein